MIGTYINLKSRFSDIIVILRIRNYHVFNSTAYQIFRKAKTVFLCIIVSKINFDHNYCPLFVSVKTIYIYIYFTLLIVYN